MSHKKNIFGYLSFCILCLLGYVIQPVILHADSPYLHVSVNQAHLSMSVHEAPLVDVVERVAQTLSLVSHVAPDLEATLVTMTVNNIPVREGLDRLLANTNYVLTDHDLYVWARGGSSGGQWRERQKEVLPRQSEENQERSQEELQHEAIFGEDPEMRSLALELLGGAGEEAIMPTLVQALQDRSPEVREMALELLGEAEGPIPLQQISKIITNDPNPEQRMEAIVVIASRDEHAAQVILEQALQDSDPEVVELARSILQDVNGDLEFDDLR